MLVQDGTAAPQSDADSTTVKIPDDRYTKTLKVVSCGHDTQRQGWQPVKFGLAEGKNWKEQEA